MKRKVYLLTILTLSLVISSYGQIKNGFEINNGVNISHWLSQSGDRQPLDVVKAFFTRVDVAYIASLGFDHIRIPIDEQRMFTEDGEKVPEAFALLHNALGWCNEFNLRAIVDLHVLRSHTFTGPESGRSLFTDPKAQEQFYEYWRKISGELNKYSIDKVAYEPMNEPVAPDPETWNNILFRCVEAIRKLEPNRTILLGPNQWNGYNNAKYLRIPANDPNLIISFHFYTPMLLSHYRAGWTDDPGLANLAVPVHYPGQLIADADMDSLSNNIARQGKMVYNVNVLENELMSIIDVGKKYNLPINCGEYGIISNAPDADKNRWFRDLYTIFERHRISRTNWDYKSSDFGMVRLISSRNGVAGDVEPQTGMINAIFGKN